jgi:hypothetical protein
VLLRRTDVTRVALVVLGIAAVATLGWWLFVHECANGGAMAGRYQTCVCRGIERLDFDATEADGPRRTVCLGIVTARTCYASRGGPEAPCAETER